MPTTHARTSRRPFSRAWRLVVWAAMLLAATLMLGTPASAQSVTASSISPPSFSGAGQTLTFSVTVNSGPRQVTSATASGGIGVSYTCAVPPGAGTNTNISFTCTGTYQTTASDVSAGAVFDNITVHIDSAGVPIDLVPTLVGAIYVAPQPTITSISPSSGPAIGGTPVVITGTNFGSANGVWFGTLLVNTFTVVSPTQIQVTTPAGTGTVSVTVEVSGGGLSNGASFTYISTVAPSVSTNPAAQTVTAGQTASFTAAASGTPTPTVQWQQSTDGGATFNNIGGATSATLSFTALASQSGHQFRAVFTNSAGTATTTAATLTVQTAPVITLQPVSATATPGAGITVSAAASGNPTPTVAWVFSQDNGATYLSLNFSPTFTVVSPNARTILVKGTFTNAAGSATTNVVTLSWVKQTQTISFTSPAPSSALVGGPTYAVAATATSGLGVSYAIDPSASSVCSISGSTVSFIGAGTCTINADQAGSSTYDPAPQVQQSFTVGQGGNVITFPIPADTIFGSPAVTMAATASSGLTVSYASNSSSVCTVSGNSVTLVGGGTCSITASQAGDSNFVAATPVTQTFAVNPGPNTITFPALSDTPFTSTPPALAATASSGLAVSYASNSTGVCTVSGTTISFVATGTCSITATQAGNVSYQAANPVTEAFAVTPGSNTITFAPLPNHALGSGSFVVSATASSGLAVTFSTSTGTVCSVSGSTVSLLSIGTCTINADQAGNANYQAANQVSQSFQVTRAVTTVGLSSSAATIYFGMPVTLTATVAGSSPTGTVAFNDGATLLGTAQLNGSTATFTTSALTAGAHQLTATYQGDANNEPGTSSPLAITVNARPDPSADPDVRGSVDQQFRTSERFARTQMNNITDRLDQLHNDGDDRDSMNLRFSQTRRRLRTGIPGSDVPLGYGDNNYGYRYGQPVSGGEALIDALSGGAAWMPGSPLGMAPAMMGTDGAGTEGEGTYKAAGSVERRPVHVWASGDVNFGKEQPNGQVESRFTSSGITVGLDGKFSDNLKLGAAFGFAWDHTRIGTNGSENHASNGSLSFYGSWRVAPRLYLDGIVGLGYGTIDTTRFSTTGSVFLDGQRRTSQTFGALIGTFEGRMGSIEIAPYLRADAIWVHLSPYTETGSPYWALAYQSADEHSYSGTVGAKVRVPLGKDSSWRLTGKAEFRTRLSGDYAQLLDYADIQGANGSPYVITGEGVDASTFTGGIGIEGQLKGLMLRLNYDLTTLAGGNISNRISGAIRVEF